MGEQADRISAIYRAGNDAISAAYQFGVEEGQRLGYDQQARDHHQWLLNHDEQLRAVAEEAVREALLDAAEAWESDAESENLDRIAKEHYRAGGPSMPTLWLRLRAATASAPAPQPAPAAQDEGEGA